MPTRAEIEETLTASQEQVVAFFQGLRREELERPATANDIPGGKPWRVRDHLAHLAQSERNVQHLLRRALDGASPNELLRLQYPTGMPLPATLGDWDALTPEEQKQLSLAVARLNQTQLDAHADDSLEMLIVDYLAARQETLALLNQFTDEQLAAPVPTVIRDVAAAELFAGNAGHATGHMTLVVDGLRRSE
jgi:hypothetical protein